MTNLITEARELCEKATLGPWIRSKFGLNILTHDSEISTATQKYTGDSAYVADQMAILDANAAFIARSRTLIPELCDALEKAEERGTGCEHCRGWDKRCGANYCPMCGKALPIYAGTIGGEIVKKAMREAEE